MARRGAKGSKRGFKPKKPKRHSSKLKQSGKKQGAEAKQSKKVVKGETDVKKSSAPSHVIQSQKKERTRVQQQQQRARASLLDEKRQLNMDDDDEPMSLEQLAQDAEKRTSAFEQQQEIANSAVDGGKEFNKGRDSENSRKQYFKEFRKVVDASDVLLHVLDARDPLGSRCSQIEDSVLKSTGNKRLVLILNKVDLIPRSNVEAWLKYLREEFPTVAFKASTQSQKENLGRSRVPLDKASDDLSKSSQCLGSESLIQLLANYCRKSDVRTTITVGVVGYPNTGKSSIINSLKRTRACQTGATPGVTKAMQEVQLDQHVKLIDSPGIVMATGSTDAAVILRNCVKVETVEDPITPVEAILKRCNKEQIREHYGITDYSSVNEFLSLLASRHGRVKRGGLPDVERAARSVLHDWNNGRITYYTVPPETRSARSQVSAEIVQQYTEEFDVDAVIQQQNTEVKGLSEAPVIPQKPTAENSVPIEAHEEEQSDMEEEEEEMLSSTVVEMPVRKSLVLKRTAQPSFSTDERKSRAERVLSGNKQLNRSKKQEYKKLIKKRKRADKLAGKLSTALESALDSFTFGVNTDRDGDDEMIAS